MLYVPQKKKNSTKIKLENKKVIILKCVYFLSSN